MSRAIVAMVSMLMPSALSARPQPLGALWHDDRGTVILTPCPPGGDHDEHCRSVDVRSAGTTTPLGSGYTRVTLLWSRPARSGTGPDVLVLGDYGGSGGRADLFAVRFGPDRLVRTLGGERFDSVAVRPARGTVGVDIPFDIEFFNGAPHAGAIVVPLPLRWDRDDFDVDLNALTWRTRPVSAIAADMGAMRAELAGWAHERPDTRSLYPPEARNGTPVTGRILVRMMLSGHADRARTLLDRAWPRDTVQEDMPLDGKIAFWNALCRAVVTVPAWRRYRLARLPHADIIERSARGSD